MCHRFGLVILFGTILFALFSPGCKKNEPGPPEPAIDPALVGIWYSSQTAIGFGVPGFEILSDGSTRNLVVDSTGKIQYAPASVDSFFKLTVLTAKSGIMTARVKVKITGVVDTTVVIPAQYALTNSNNTLSLTLPDPTSGQMTTIVFQRVTIGGTAMTFHNPTLPSPGRGGGLSSIRRQRLRRGNCPPHRGTTGGSHGS